VRQILDIHAPIPPLHALPEMEDGMRFLRTTPYVLALASPLAGCFSISYTRHDANEGRPYYYDQSYCSGGYPCSSNPGTYYYF